MEVTTMKTKLFSLLLILVLVLSSACTASAASVWPTVNADKRIAFIADRTIPVYKNTALTVRGTVVPIANQSTAEIWAGDDCYVVKIVNDKTLLVDYPAGGRRKQGYVARKEVFPGVPSNALIAKACVDTFQCPYGGAWGYIDTNDKCYFVGKRNGSSYPYGFIYPSPPGASGSWGGLRKKLIMKCYTVRTLIKVSPAASI